MSRAIKRKRDAMDDKGESSNEVKHLFCELCKIKLPNEASMKEHVVGQKHKKLQGAEDERRRVEQKCGLFIRGFPPDLSKETIRAYFSKFGKIVWDHFVHTFLLLDYEKPSTAEEVINGSHYLGGQRLTIKYRELRKQDSVRNTKNEEPNDFIQSLRNIPNFEDQVRILGLSLQPVAQQQFPKYNRVCGDLYKVLHRAFPYCCIHPFGSTITGLGFNNSDVDVFISGVRQGNNDVPFLYKTKHLLLNSQLFSNIIVIPQAKIPILKCVHVDTGVNCDINLRNMLGVCNSRLINYYLNLDPKLRKLMVVLKFWAKTHKITGQNHLFTNYSLNLMLIFFLQHRPFQIPSVLMLQQDPRFYNNQDGWNGGFQPVRFASSELYQVSLRKLLEMFYTFYIEFEYGVNVICPYLGFALKKQVFKEPYKLRDYYHTYKLYVAATEQHLKVDTPLCIQDPFEHSRNTTPIVSATTLEAFVSFCRLGKKFCVDKEGSILFKLLTEVPPDLSLLTVVKSELGQFTIPMRAGMKYIEREHTTNTEKHKAWFESVTNFTRIVLEDFLRLDVTEVGSPDSKKKHTKLDGQVDVYHGKMRISYKCNGKLNLWNGRKSTAKNNRAEGDETKKSIVERETEVTEQLCNLYKDVNGVDDIISFEINLEYSENPPKVTVEVKKISAYKNSFISFMKFLSANLPHWFKVFEQEQNEYT